MTDRPRHPEHYLQISAVFQEVGHVPHKTYLVPFSNSEEMSTWKSEFWTALEALNQEFDLGLMTCIAADISYMRRHELGANAPLTKQAVEEVIAGIRDSYLVAKAA